MSNKSDNPRCGQCDYDLPPEDIERSMSMDEGLLCWFCFKMNQPSKEELN